MNVTHLDQHLSLRQHLLKFGIRHAVDRSVSSSPEFAPEPRQLKRLEQLGRALDKSRPSRTDVLAFYELLAAPRLAGWAHSRKADAIRACGEFVQQMLTGGRILDIGCNIGYLTSWYAVRNPAAEVQGIDLSPSSIAAAKQHAARLRIANLRYAVADATRFSPEGPIDSIVDSQGLIDTETPSASIERLLSWLAPGGQLICVPALGTLAHFSTLLDRLAPLACRIDAMHWLGFAIDGHPGAYPALIIRPGNAAQGMSRATLLAEYQRGWLDIRQQARPVQRYG